MAEDRRDGLVSSTWAVMEWSFEPRQDHDLAASEGEHVLVVKRIDENWFLAENEQGKRGYVPTAYARIERSAAKIVRAASSSRVSPRADGLTSGKSTPRGVRNSPKGKASPKKTPTESGRRRTLKSNSNSNVSSNSASSASIPQLTKQNSGTPRRKGVGTHGVVTDEELGIVKFEGRPTGNKTLTKRNRVVDEIVTTEYTYVRSIRAIVLVCKQTFKDVVSPAELKTLFMNIEQLDQFADVFLPALRGGCNAQ